MLAVGTTEGKLLLCADDLETQSETKLGDAPVSGACAFGNSVLAVDESGNAALIAGARVDRAKEDAVYTGLARLSDGVAVATDASYGLAFFASDAPAVDEAQTLETPSTLTASGSGAIVGTSSGRVLAVTQQRRRSLPPIEREAQTLCAMDGQVWALDEAGQVWHWASVEDAPVAVGEAAAICVGALGVIIAQGSDLRRIGGEVLLTLDATIVMIAQGHDCVYAALENGEVCLLLPNKAALSVARRRRIGAVSLLTKVG